jgi:hypothetical protein
MTTLEEKYVKKSNIYLKTLNVITPEKKKLWRGRHTKENPYFLSSMNSPRKFSTICEPSSGAYLTQ